LVGSFTDAMITHCNSWSLFGELKVDSYDNNRKIRKGEHEWLQE